MSLKIEVTDRVPTYPGRVVMTPVNGQANTYDLRRADQPISEGTPINKALLDQKAYPALPDPHRKSVQKTAHSRPFQGI